MTMLDTARLEYDDVRVATRPFAFVVAPRQLDETACERLIDDFPRYGSAGFFPYLPDDCGPSLRALIDELMAPSFADPLGKHLGIDNLGALPTIVTLSDSVNRRHGTIHTDSKSKVATALLYFNPDWPQTSDGCLRFLTRGDDIAALAAPEIRPLYGTLVAFRRADNSWHGHLPFEGRRLVIQVAWLTSQAEADRKNRRGRFSRLVKKVAGALDRRWGARRGVNARHD